MSLLEAMYIRLSVSVGLILFVLSLPVIAQDPPREDLSRYCRMACSDRAEKRDNGIRKLRAGGPESLEVLFSQLSLPSRDQAVDGTLPAEMKRNIRIVERVAGQKNAHLSRLFWYKNLDRAKKAAQRSGRPILSLHLFGRLDEAFS